MPWINRSPFTKGFIDFELSLGWKDLLSKERRVDKRLKETFLTMVSHIDDELLTKRASSLEVLVACGAAVWQGYWYSSAPDDEKRKALDAFANFLFTIVFNECYLQDDSYQSAEGQERNLDVALNTAEEKFRNLFVARTDEYTNGALAFLNGENFPLTLARSLSRNLLLPEKQATDKEGRDLWDATIMACVAVPFVATFAEVRKKFH